MKNNRLGFLRLKIYLSWGLIAPPPSDVSLEKTTCYRSWRGSSTYSSHLNTDSESCIFPRRQEPSWLICSHGWQTETFPSEVDSFCFTICEVFRVCWNSIHYLDTCLWCGFIWSTYMIRWYTSVHDSDENDIVSVCHLTTVAQILNVGQLARHLPPPRAHRRLQSQLHVCRRKTLQGARSFDHFFYFEEKKNFVIYLYLLSLPTSTSGGYFTSVKWTSSSHFGR